MKLVILVRVIRFDAEEKTIIVRIQKMLSAQRDSGRSNRQGGADHVDI